MNSEFPIKVGEKFKILGKTYEVRRNLRRGRVIIKEVEEKKKKK